MKKILKKYFLLIICLYNNSCNVKSMHQISQTNIRSLLPINSNNFFKTYEIPDNNIFTNFSGNPDLGSSVFDIQFDFLNNHSLAVCENLNFPNMPHYTYLGNINNGGEFQWAQVIQKPSVNYSSDSILRLNGVSVDKVSDDILYVGDSPSGIAIGRSLSTDGTIQWIKEILQTDGYEAIGIIQTLDEKFAILGSNGIEHLLIKFDQTGSIDWSTKYEVLNIFSETTSTLIQLSDESYVTGSIVEDMANSNSIYNEINKFNSTGGHILSKVIPISNSIFDFDSLVDTNSPSMVPFDNSTFYISGLSSFSPIPILNPTKPFVALLDGQAEVIWFKLIDVQMEFNLNTGSAVSISKTPDNMILLSLFQIDFLDLLLSSDAIPTSIFLKMDLDGNILLSNKIDTDFDSEFITFGKALDDSKIYMGGYVAEDIDQDSRMIKRFIFKTNMTDSIFGCIENIDLRTIDVLNIVPDDAIVNVSYPNLVANDIVVSVFELNLNDEDQCIPTVSPTVSPSLFPSINPTLSPTNDPSLFPTLFPSMSPTISPTPSPTPSPSPAPSDSPTPVPTISPTPSPSPAPSDSPTPVPTVSPTPSPSPAPSDSPTPVPTISPTPSPSPAPSDSPTPVPTVSPTPSPSPAPSDSPTPSPSPAPSDSPTPVPTISPTPSPSPAPSDSPTPSPSPAPSDSPTPVPTISPTPSPSPAPSDSPTPVPTISPTPSPSPAPSDSPTPVPTISPTPSPSPAPSDSPTPSPSPAPSDSPTPVPSNSPTPSPSPAPTDSPIPSPTGAPTLPPTPSPTMSPIPAPTLNPSLQPSLNPSTSPLTITPTISLEELEDEFGSFSNIGFAIIIGEVIILLCFVYLFIVVCIK